MEEKNVTAEAVSEETVSAEAVSEEAAEKAELEKTKAELEKTKKDLAAANDKYLRMIAEYDNYRKRSQKEKESTYTEAYGDALTAILPVIDNLERALAYSEGETLTEGVRMTLKQFEDIMERLGVKAFGERGEEFNPEFHNAVMQTEDEELGENKIAEVLQKGYSKGDKVIRYAMVKVTV